ncbi:hypothetical protein CC79DRAFT_543930 [Sarocladium strictum]
MLPHTRWQVRYSLTQAGRIVVVRPADRLSFTVVVLAQPSSPRIRTRIVTGVFWPRYGPSSLSCVIMSTVVRAQHPNPCCRLAISTGIRAPRRSPAPAGPPSPSMARCTRKPRNSTAKMIWKENRRARSQHINANPIIGQQRRDRSQPTDPTGPLHRRQVVLPPLPELKLAPQQLWYFAVSKRKATIASFVAWACRSDAIMPSGPASACVVNMVLMLELSALS